MSINVIIIDALVLRNQPLLLDAVDRQAYVARPGLEQELLAASERAQGVLVVGPSGSGRTTMLNWLAGALAPLPVARVDAAPMTEASELIEGIATALAGVHSDGGPAALKRRPTAADTAAVRLQLATRALAEYPPSYVLIDNLADVTLSRRVFGGLRELLWQSGHTFVVAVRREDLADVLAPPADAFFRRRVTVGPFGEGEISQLIANSELDADEAVRRLRGRPAYPREMVDALTADESPELDAAFPSDLSEAARDLWTQLALLRRPAAVDDAELKARVGRSTITLRRHLNELAAAGLVEKAAERTGKPGRPTIKYSARRESQSS